MLKAKLELKLQKSNMYTQKFPQSSIIFHLPSQQNIEQINEEKKVKLHQVWLFSSYISFPLINPHSDSHLVYLSSHPQARWLKLIVHWNSTLSSETSHEAKITLSQKKWGILCLLDCKVYYFTRASTSGLRVKAIVKFHMLFPLKTQTLNPSINHPKHNSHFHRFCFT